MTTNGSVKFSSLLTWGHFSCQMEELCQELLGLFVCQLYHGHCHFIIIVSSIDQDHYKLHKQQTKVKFATALLKTNLLIL